MSLDRSLLVATAISYVGLTGELAPAADAPAGTQAGWDAEFVYHAGYSSHFDFELESSRWPVPATSSLAELAAWAHDQGLARESAEPGYLFLLRSPATERYERIGIVARVDSTVELEPGKLGYHCTTIEGDSSDALIAGGGKVVRAERLLAAWHHDLFIDWSSYGLRYLA